MVLAIDIGNSNVVVALHDGNSWSQVWRIPTITEADAALFYEKRLADLLMEAGLLLGPRPRVVVSSVVPQLTQSFLHIAEHLFGQPALKVAPPIYPKLKLQIDRPNEIGTDLLANAVAAHHLYQQDCIVVDFGTALTFTTVTGEGHILGVAIAPGLKTAIASLFQKTAQLPEVPLTLPQTPIGKNTEHAIQSGILIGYVGLVRHMLAEIRREVGEQYIAVATGGLSSILTPLQADFQHIDPMLTLEGLRIIAETQRSE
ncbi:MAG: type III pantothenate kinase [Haliscomenobacter sp.]|uniref:type III pantothenate kinase n=1 Tax=Haliscomenobacter sp. TaxID=2717303 RepID=UPI0029BF5ABB|nr:type III pantothenate kinase [Haliscomenobacter sp.]MDX2071374.1 type III pantothenate kinase [Haliscomenobacter sp.]